MIMGRMMMARISREEATAGLEHKAACNSLPVTAEMGTALQLIQLNGEYSDVDVHDHGHDLRLKATIRMYLEVGGERGRRSDSFTRSTR
ncbi:hypothetical protein L6452_03044 [Arctium lappa]|uniref:Uncharacterized protein n=1 Tax=Arctium lappa TaxID=4217 RepID=A0ACB9FM41_ARCLA|nr:hypothetical protein L6452_03044 [Arctium lappa]